jgi:hypothetical protein
MRAAIRRQAGYTVIELSLFLGISALLFTVAIFATGNTIRSARFTDSGRSLEAFVQKQYDNIINGVNPRASSLTCSGGVVSNGTQTPGTSSCLLVGKLLLFHGSSYTVTAYDIVAEDPGINVNFSKTDEQLIAEDYQPQVVTGANELPYDIPWQTPVSGIKRTSDGLATNALALIRSPRSQRILSYSYKEGVSPTAGLLLSVVGAPATNSGKTVNFCISSPDGFGAWAKLQVTGASNQSAAHIMFDAVSGDCDGS